MGAPEIGWRIGTAAAEATRVLVPRERVRRVLDDPTEQGWARAFECFRAGSGRPVVLDEARAAELARDLPDEVSAVVEAADGALEGSFAFFGQKAVRYAGGIDWNYDPRTGYRWPDRPAARINHRTLPGDPKWIWELNRLQHLPWLAQAWLFTGEERYAEGALAQLDSWLDQNPTGRGIAWRGGFEAGLRAISVAIAVQGLRHAPSMTVERYRRIVTMLAESADICWRERSRFSSANNHLLGELAGAATVGILFPELAGARRWERKALRALAREADRQILPDGVGAEQSSVYLIFSAQLLLVPAVLVQLRRTAATTSPISSGTATRCRGTATRTVGSPSGCIRSRFPPSIDTWRWPPPSRAIGEPCPPTSPRGGWPGRGSWPALRVSEPLGRGAGTHRTVGSSSCATKADGSWSTSARSATSHSPHTGTPTPSRSRSRPTGTT
jgi:hypothetical protein